MITYLFTQTPLKFLVQDFWRDEAFSFVMAKEGILSLLVATARDFNPPLYYLLLKVWMVIFGSSEIALRSVSLLFFWATCYIAFLFMNEIVKMTTKKSLLYLLLFVCNPILVYYAFEARMYTMLAFFATWSYYSYYKRNLGKYMIATALGLFTHYFMLLVVLSQFAHALVTERTKPHIGFLLKKMVTPLLIFTPWVLFVMTQNATVGNSFWIAPPHPKDIFLIPGLMYTGYERQFGFLAVKDSGIIPTILLISLLMIALLVAGLMNTRSDRYTSKFNLFTLFSFWALVPLLIAFAVSFFKPLFLPRYLIFTTVPMLLLIVLSLDHMNRMLKVAFIAALVIMTWQYHDLQLKHRKKDRMSPMMNEIKSLAKEDDVVYVTNILDYFTAQYYFGINRVYVYGKPYNEIPQFVGKALIPRERVVNVLPLYPKKAFILKGSGKYDIQSIY